VDLREPHGVLAEEEEEEADDPHDAGKTESRRLHLHVQAAEAQDEQERCHDLEGEGITFSVRITGSDFLGVNTGYVIPVSTIGYWAGSESTVSGISTSSSDITGLTAVSADMTEDLYMQITYPSAMPADIYMGEIMFSYVVM